MVCLNLCLRVYMLRFFLFKLFFFIVDLVIVIEYFVDIVFCDYEISGVRVVGGLVWCFGLRVGRIFYFYWYVVIGLLFI